LARQAWKARDLELQKAMKLWITSDLHVDVAPGLALPDPRPEHDVVVIAGDILEDMHKGVHWIASSGLNDKPVIYVAGNHEFYRQAIDKNRVKALNEADKHRNIHILQDSYIDVDGVRFIGSTLWTDYCLYGDAFAWQSYTAAQAGMNDHRLIRVAKNGFAKFRTKDAYNEHVASRRFIEAALSQPFDGARVVVTHHAPSAKSIDLERFAGDVLNGAYASNLDHLVDKADLWIHGHIHKVSDYRIGDGRVICNPRGYEGLGELSGYDPSLTIDVTHAGNHSSKNPS
jgi:Icc-related predicted phosphoesterase